MIRAGVSKVCITPPVGTWQGGYGARTRPAEGVHDDLYARAIVLREGEGDSLATAVAIVSLDVVGLQRDLADGARRRAADLTGIPAEHIALCCSHTHGGPIFRPFVGRDGPQPDADYLLLLEKYLAGAVAAAARELRPVSLRLGHGAAYFNVNRRLKTPEGLLMRPNPDGAVDREALVLRVDEVDGGAAQSAAPLAVLFRFTCHATAMGATNYLFTADYPGAAAAHIESAYGGSTTALFLQGCAGDIRPHLTSATGGFTGADWPILARLGRELGASVVSGAERTLMANPAGASDGPVAVASETISLPYDDYPDKPAGQDEGMPAEVQVFRLGPYAVVALPGEVFVEIGWRARDAVARQLEIDPSHVIVTAYANGSIGYLPTGAAVQEGGYETTAYKHQGRPAGYVLHAEDLLVEAATRVAARLRRPS